ncbi:MAG: sn-glycerol-3-phosphate ABC transporter ATP-binding protein UgpC [Deltaproteobacteria bacterium]|nr:sn-glycerol-3-phosphate ABC transporter ATP-binding protein UgpC [Deltaproteobacteria bacterium]
MAQIRFVGVRKAFGDVVIVKNLDLEVADGEFVVLVGPSGCGKSTILRMIAGLESITAGDLYIGDRRVNDVAPKDRDIAMVFQSYALYPHLTVRENIGFGLAVRRTPSAEIAKKVDEVAARLGLSALLDRKPRQLSGGQRQRVAMGRAIVRRPKAFLFDEPLSNLDAKLRSDVRADLARLRRQLGTTTVYVTHDQVEAMTLADRVVVLEGGVAQQIGAPLDVYARPSNIFVAGFLGSPTMNFIPVKVDAGTLKLDDGRSLELSAPAATATLGVRPQSLLVGTDGIPFGEVEVDVVERLGAESFALCRGGKQPLTALVRGGHQVTPGKPAPLALAGDGIHFFDAQGLRIEARA